MPIQRLILPLVLLLLGALAFLGTRYLTTPADVVTLDPGRPCDLGIGPCRHALPDGGSLTLELQPRPIPLMKTLRLDVRLEGSPLTPRQVDITGLNMDMGLNRARLRALGPGYWVGETILPVCSQRRMHWQLALMLEQQGQRWQVVDQFHTRR